MKHQSKNHQSTIINHQSSCVSSAESLVGNMSLNPTKKSLQILHLPPVAIRMAHGLHTEKHRQGIAKWVTHSPLEHFEHTASLYELPNALCLVGARSGLSRMDDLASSPSTVVDSSSSPTSSRSSALNSLLGLSDPFSTFPGVSLSVYLRFDDMFKAN